jgi:hypothetical protein
MQPTRVLQPGRYTPGRSGHDAAENFTKYLQISTITGRISTRRHTPSATLDQLVEVRILLRQLPKSPILRGFSITHFLLNLHKPPPTLSALW